MDRDQRKPNPFWKAGVSFVACLLMVFLVWRIEPFEPRFEGRTLRGWFQAAAASGRLPPEDVLEHYGLSATDFLMRQVSPPSIPLPVAWEEQYFSWLSDQPDYGIAVEWLAYLADFEPEEARRSQAP